MSRFVLAISMILFNIPVHAFFSVMDTGNLTQKDEYRVQGEGQVLFDPPKGFNLNGRFATGLNSDSEVQFEAGVGSVDYYLGAFWKWVPFPDTADQPAAGLRAGLTFADFNGFSTYGFNITPIVSKNLESDLGVFTPYGGVQMGLQNNVADTFFSLQAVLGLQWSPNEWDFKQLEDFDFLIEYGIEIDDSFNYLSFGAAYNF